MFIVDLYYSERFYLISYHTKNDQALGLIRRVISTTWTPEAFIRFHILPYSYGSESLLNGDKRPVPQCLRDLNKSCCGRASSAAINHPTLTDVCCNSGEEGQNEAVSAQLHVCNPLKTGCHPIDTELSMDDSITTACHINNINN